MEGRQSQAERYCQHTGTKDGETDEQHSPKSCPLVSLTHPSIFCSVPSIGSTFWSRFYKVLDRNVSSLLDSPFTVPAKVANRERCQSARKFGSLRENGRYIMKSTFVRDPFSRLFSAYVDKLLAPNPTFWTTWGIPAMLLEGGLEAKDVTCGHAVTFQQFVRLVNNRLHREDPHVISVVRTCHPCEISYDVIGKMETFSEDLRYLTSVLNVTFDPRLSLATESKVDAILDSVESPFEWREDITKCISTQEMGRRIWRKLQIRGIISTFHDYPLADEDLSTVSSTVFSKAALEAAIKSTDKDQLVLQKRQAFMEAYRTLSMDDIHVFSQLFADDFEAFGYDKRPAAVFDRNLTFVDTHAFDVNTPWATS
ncbi:carbohydrate sulfotransferase 12-like [Pomacea canaliculata]|nr:carbohydrate sulfotransferase 12-like [Pomacea canaliculata]